MVKKNPKNVNGENKYIISSFVRAPTKFPIKKKAFLSDTSNNLFSKKKRE
jgi:hypothetical protein